MWDHYQFSNANILMDVVFYLDLENIIKTRKHSSGKHTVPFCGYEGYDVTSYLVVPMFLWGGEEVWSQRGVWHYLQPPPREQMDTCRNITFPQLRLRAVIVITFVMLF